MTSIMLKLTGAKAQATVDGILTAGMVGIPVTIEYDDTWDGLTKHLVCRCSKWGPDRGITRTVPDIENVATVAREVMLGDYYLYLGVEGYSADGKLVIPSTWADCGKIQHSANAGDDPSTNPYLPIWAQMQTEIRQLQQNAVTNESLGDGIKAYLEKTPIAAPDTLTLGVHSDGLVYIFLGGKPVGNGLNIASGEVVEPVYGQPVMDNAILSIAEGQTVQLGVMLDEKPTQEQNITVLTECAALTFDKTLLTFTPENWNVMQFVSVTAGDIDEDTTATIVLQNSDKLLTGTNITVYLTADGYAVDTTIPKEGQHIVTVADFENTAPYGDYIRLYGYKGEYDNIVIPSKLDGKTPWICCASPSPTTENTTFSYGNTTIKYVTFEDGVIYKAIGNNAATCDASGLFVNCSNLIGVSNMNPATTSLANAFKGCSSLRFIDNIGQLANVLYMDSAFDSSGIEYLPDLSAMTAVVSMKATFMNCANLKRVYGMPKPTASCDTRNVFNGCAALEKAEIPENASTMFFAFNGCASLRSVNVMANGISEVYNAFAGCTGLTVYAPADSTTYTALVDAYGNSTNVTLAILGSGGALPVIAVWGDSTSSPNGTWKEWPRRLQEAVVTYLVKNQAVSGEYTTSTSARQGGNTLRVGAFRIPGDTSLVEITLTSADGQIFGTSPVFSCGGGFNPCTIAGVQGAIVNAGSGVYKFARKTAGESVDVPAGTVVISEADSTFNNADAVMLVNLGINSGWNENADTLLNQVQLMVNHFTASGGTKYIITGPYAGKFLVTEVLRQEVFAYETKAANTFGEHWLNLREYLIANGLTENGLTASALDTERMAVGQIPASLLGGGSTTDIRIYDGKTVTDQTHPNAHGQNSIFNAFYAKGQELGYWE